MDVVDAAAFCEAALGDACAALALQAAPPLKAWARRGAAAASLQVPGAPGVACPFCGGVHEATDTERDARDGALPSHAPTAPLATATGGCRCRGAKASVLCLC